MVGNDPSTNNATGFSAVPAGACCGSSFGDAGRYAYFWSSTQYTSYTAYKRNLFYLIATVGGYSDGKALGNSVRCLRDQSGNTALVPITWSCATASGC